MKSVLKFIICTFPGIAFMVLLLDPNYSMTWQTVVTVAAVQIYGLLRIYAGSLSNDLNRAVKR